MSDGNDELEPARRRLRPRPGQVVWWAAGVVLVAAAVALALLS